MSDNVKSVAVVGAGISGVCAAAHLLRQGLSVTVYERGSVAGGVWHFDQKTAHEQRYPNELPSLGDYERVTFEDEDLYDTPPRTPPGGHQSSDQDGRLSHHIDAELKGATYMSIAHASPGPCYVHLKNNVSLPAMKTTLGTWPVGLDDFVNQRYLEEYIQQIARDHKVDQATHFNTRVEDIRKINSKWRVCTTKYVSSDQDSNLDSAKSITAYPRLRKRIDLFDAVVVASGHYHMPRIPNIPGLANAKSKYPERISHSKGYRSAEKYRDSNILIVGAGVSSLDIAKEIVSVGGTVYQSSRGGQYDLPAKMLPTGAHRVAGIEAFIPRNSLDPETSINGEEIAPAEHQNNTHAAIDVDIKLQNGHILTNIHFIILATGYITSYPFLPDKHADQTPRTEADSHVLVTKEGDMVHNLYKDIFYIEDPTLAFIGVPYHISTFSLFDFQAQVVAHVYSGTCSGRIPAKQVMRTEYEERVRRVGLGREFHSLRSEGAEIEYVSDLVGLVNLELRDDEESMLGHTEAWHVAHRKQREMLAERLGKEALERRR